ncbi:YceD family protein [Pseudotabrizicola alkalilacus]|uniref:YceD family protein n=1 Tax=Pseudotabrizicola alkalilacus TaxID=2305252 RepID=UPI0026D9FF3C
MKKPSAPVSPPEVSVPATPPAMSQTFRSGALSMRKPTRFDLQPDAATRKAIADELGLLSVPFLHFKGEIRPAPNRDFVLEAELKAVVAQPCVVTLAPVRAEITETVLRRYVSDWEEPTGDEAEMPEDDTAEPIPEVIDVGLVALEALVLALPLYPRAAGAELGEVAATPPGAEPLRDADLKPFASLAALKDKMEGGAEG